MKPLLLAAAATFAQHAFAAGPPPHLRFPKVVVSMADLETYRSEVLAKQSASVAARKACTYITVEPEWSVYVFTNPGHSAHPAVFVLYAEEEHQGASKRRIWGHTAGDQKAFSAYLEDERAPPLRRRKLLAASCAQ